MASTPVPVPPTPQVAVPSTPLAADMSLWDRIASWVAGNKATVYTVLGVTVVVTGAGAVYYISNSSTAQQESRPSKKERRKRKQAERDALAKQASGSTEADKKQAVVEDEVVELPKIDEVTVLNMSLEERQALAAKLKELGNKAYGAKDLDKAIDLYTKAILCKPDPIYYGNRAACYNSLGQWEKVVEDCTAAINMDPRYVKALNRRANAYDHLDMYSEALLDFTASCIIERFTNPVHAQALEKLLKKSAESKAKAILLSKPLRLPSATFIGNYLNSFRAKPRPAGLEDSADLADDTGKGQLRIGLRGMEKATAEGYAEAAEAFDKALTFGDLGDFEALAYNLRGTFQCLRGQHEEAVKDLTKSILVDPTMTQSYIKRASMNLELGDPQAAEKDFEMALEQNPSDPDIYYHRAQLHFIKGEFQQAAMDYQQSIDLDKDFIFSHIQLGVAQYKMGSIASSMATFRRCMSNFPDVPDVYNYYGELMLDQGKHQEAIEKFDYAISLESKTKPLGMNVLPLINKGLALVQWKQDFAEAEKLCQKALIIDPDCDIALATSAQLYLQQGKTAQALQAFERAAELARTEGELINSLSYAEATRTQIQVAERYPDLAAELSQMGSAMPS